ESRPDGGQSPGFGSGAPNSARRRARFDSRAAALSRWKSHRPRKNRFRNAMNDLSRNTVMTRTTQKDDAAAGSSCIAFVIDEPTRTTVQTVCQARHERLVVREGGSREALDYATRYALPRILIIDISDNDRPLEVLHPILAAAEEDSRLIAIGSVNDVTLYREMMEAGVSDYLVKPLTDRALLAAIQHADSRETRARSGAASVEKA